MRRILVVEDDRLVSETILCVLEEHYRVTLASSVSDAAARLREGVFDLVLLDCILPGGTVADLIEQAELLGATVVLTSGNPEQIQAHANGRRPFLAKPFSLSRLLEVVTEVGSPDSAPLPDPPGLPESPGQIGLSLAPQPVLLGSSAPAGGLTAVLSAAMCAAALQIAATTLFAAIYAPAAAGSALSPD